VATPSCANELVMTEHQDDSAAWYQSHVC